MAKVHGKQKSNRDMEELLQMCRLFLKNNFKSFSVTNKLRVSLELLKKDMVVKQEHKFSDGGLTLYLKQAEEKAKDVE